VRIREAGDDDQELVTRMRVAFLTDESGADAISEALAAETRAFLQLEHAAGRLRSWLAEDDDGACVGIVTLLLHAVPPNPKVASSVEGYVVNMYVTPDRRSQGVGRGLLDAVLASGREQGLRRIVLHATDAGRPLYESAGFTTDDTWLKLFLG
jgi:GNAT superfamily N-acetyltransferase